MAFFVRDDDFVQAAAIVNGAAKRFNSTPQQIAAHLGVAYDGSNESNAALRKAILADPTLRNALVESSGSFGDDLLTVAKNPVSLIAGGVLAGAGAAAAGAAGAGAGATSAVPSLTAESLTSAGVSSSAAAAIDANLAAGGTITGAGGAAAAATGAAVEPGAAATPEVGGAAKPAADKGALNTIKELGPAVNAGVTALGLGLAAGAGSDAGGGAPAPVTPPELPSESDVQKQFAIDPDLTAIRRKNALLFGLDSPSSTDLTRGNAQTGNLGRVTLLGGQSRLGS